MERLKESSEHLHLDLHPPLLIPLQAGQCLCSDLLKNKTKDFSGEAREARRGAEMEPTCVGFKCHTGMSSY